MLGGANGFTGLEPELGGALRPPVDMRLWRELLSRDYRRICRAADEIGGQGERNRYIDALAEVARPAQGKNRFPNRQRRSALEALSVISEPNNITALDAILKALKDSSWEIRQYAAWALGRLGDLRATEALIKALNDESPYVRQVAADALQHFGTGRARAALDTFWGRAQDRTLS